jgi:hypothetical protein
MQDTESRAIMSLMTISHPKRIWRCVLGAEEAGPDDAGLVTICHQRAKPLEISHLGAVLGSSLRDGFADSHVT